MPKFIHFAAGLVLAAAALVVYPAPAHSAAMSGSQDQAAIEALEARFAAAFNAKDANAIMRVYEPGAALFVFDVTPPRQHVGAADYRADWQDTFRQSLGPVRFSISDLKVTVVGPIAYGHSIQTVRFTRPNGSKAELVVRVTDVYRKLHGKWLIVQEHVSVPVDIDTGKADLLSKP